MDHQIRVDSSARADLPERDGYHEILNDLAYKRLGMVNVVYYGIAGATDRKWTLIDAGLPGMARMIVHAAERRFGRASRPAAIILTHGHVDHAGSVAELAERWDVPIYAHELELPFLQGRGSYPRPDPGVGGGLMSMMSPLFSRGPINVRKRLLTLPADASVPGMPGWRWIHTPGHTPGHVSLWRPADRVAIVGDAFITTKQESAYAVATQEVELHGPPMYFTTDWTEARASVERLAALEAQVVITGHGRPLHGPQLRRALHVLADNFNEVAVPKQGRHARAGNEAPKGP